MYIYIYRYTRVPIHVLGPSGPGVFLMPVWRSSLLAARPSWCAALELKDCSLRPLLPGPQEYVNKDSFRWVDIKWVALTGGL